MLDLWSVVLIVAAAGTAAAISPSENVGTNPERGVEKLAVPPDVADKWAENLGAFLEEFTGSVAAEAKQHERDWTSLVKDIDLVLARVERPLGTAAELDGVLLAAEAQADLEAEAAQARLESEALRNAQVEGEPSVETSADTVMESAPAAQKAHTFEGLNEFLPSAAESVAKDDSEESVAVFEPGVALEGTSVPSPDSSEGSPENASDSLLAGKRVATGWAGRSSSRRPTATSTVEVQKNVLDKRGEAISKTLAATKHKHLHHRGQRHTRAGTSSHASSAQRSTV